MAGRTEGEGVRVGRRSLSAAAWSQYQLITAQSRARLPLGRFCAGARPSANDSLGHYTPGFTLATYQHVIPGMQEEATQTFGDILEACALPPTSTQVEVPVEGTGCGEALPTGRASDQHLLGGGGPMVALATPSTPVEVIATLALA
jgi:hypothetical protein